MNPNIKLYSWTIRTQAQKSEEHRVPAKELTRSNIKNQTLYPKIKLYSSTRKNNSQKKSKLKNNRTCFTAKSSPESRFIPIYTLPKAPQPINSPFRHRIGGDIFTDGEMCLLKTRELRMQELNLSTKFPPENGVGEFAVCASVVDSAVVRNTIDRRTEPKRSCIGECVNAQ